MKFVNSYCDKTIDMKLHNKRLKQIRKLKIRFYLVSIFGNSDKKIRFLKKHNVFASIGENVLYQPKTIPNNSKLIKIHNNVRIAADVIFYEHDVINELFSSIDNEGYISHMNCIEIYDNVFIGGKSIILSGVKIGPNAIVGAGSVVTKDVPEGSIVAGNPARVVGNFEDLHKKRKKQDSTKDNNVKLLEHYDELWEKFSK